MPVYPGALRLARVPLTRIIHCSCGMAGRLVSHAMARLGRRGLWRAISYRRLARQLGRTEKITVETSRLRVLASKRRTDGASLCNRLVTTVIATDIQSRLTTAFA